MAIVTHQIETTFSDGRIACDTWIVKFGRPTAKALRTLVDGYNQTHDGGPWIASARIVRTDGARTPVAEYRPATPAAPGLASG